MEIITFIIFLLLLALISFQDIKDRLVSWWVFPLLCISTFFLEIQMNWQLRLEYALINLVFIFVQFFLLSVYYSIKYQKWQNIANRFIGWGDILFFVVLIGAFSPMHYIIVFVLGLLFTIIVRFVTKVLKISKSETIPLAGFFSVFLIVLEFMAYFKEYSFYKDELITVNILKWYV